MEQTDEIREPQPLTEEQVKQALHNTGVERLPHSKNDLEDIDVNHLSAKSIFLYKLESLVETRTISRKIEVYDGSPIDGRENGTVPDVWEAPVRSPGSFVEAEATFLMPHSEEVHLCTSCEGEGRIYCPKCSGYGRRRRASQVVANPKSIAPEKP